MPTGYCTLEDLRRALRKSGLPGDLSQDQDIAIDAITAQTEWLEKKTHRHWYVPGGVGEDSVGIIPTSPKSRDDEESIPMSSAFVVDGTQADPKTWQGDYTRIELARRDAESISELLVRTDGSYEDWVNSDEYEGGTWPDALGRDYVLRINNGGVSHLYLDTTNFWDVDAEEWLVDSWANVAYVTFDYGHEGIPQTVRRAVAFRAGSDFVDEAAVQIPENARVQSIESKGDEMERKAEELLEPYMDG